MKIDYWQLSAFTQVTPNISKIDLLFLAVLKYGDYLRISPHELDILQKLDMSKIVLVVFELNNLVIDDDELVCYTMSDKLTEFYIIYPAQNRQYCKIFNYINYSVPQDLIQLLKCDMINIVLSSGLDPPPLNRQIQYWKAASIINLILMPKIHKDDTNILTLSPNIALDRLTTILPSLRPVHSYLSYFRGLVKGF